ncbi:MAG: hypothetical protein ACK56F_12220, partial [bacterium]
GGKDKILHFWDVTDLKEPIRSIDTQGTNPTLNLISRRNLPDNVPLQAAMGFPGNRARREDLGLEQRRRTAVRRPDSDQRAEADEEGKTPGRLVAGLEPRRNQTLRRLHRQPHPLLAGQEQPVINTRRCMGGVPRE